MLRKNSDDTWAEKGSPTYQVNHGDCPSGPIDRDGVEVEEAGKVGKQPPDLTAGEFNRRE